MRGEIQRFKGCQGDGNKTFFASLSAVCHLKRGQSDVNSKLRRGLLGGVKSRRTTSFRRSHRYLHFRRQLTLLCGALWRRRRPPPCDTNKLLQAEIKITTLNPAFAEALPSVSVVSTAMEGTRLGLFHVAVTDQVTLTSI